MNQLATLAGSTKRFHHERDAHKNTANVKRPTKAKAKAKGGASDPFYVVPIMAGSEKVQWARDGKSKMAQKYRQLKHTDKVALEAVREMATATGKRDAKKENAEIKFFESMIGQELVETCTESRTSNKKTQAVLKFLLEVVHLWIAKDKAQGGSQGNGTNGSHGSGNGQG